MTVITKVAVPVPPAFTAPMVTLVVPATVGVPEIAPVVVLRVKPAGKAVEVKLVGVLVAVIE